MHTGLLLWCSAFIDDAGSDGPDPYDRHHSPQSLARPYAALVEWAKLADGLGYDSFWMTEHHFQREGYEIVPNPLLVGAVLAQHTRRLKFGSMFHQVPIWHPLRLAEDFAIADVMSGGRMLFGAGRGSVEREAFVFGASFGRNGDEPDRANRELFEEHMQIMHAAWSQASFAHRGKYYDLPPSGFTNTGTGQGRAFDRLTLVPAPLRAVEIWQALSSEATFHYAAKHGHKGVLTLSQRKVTLPRWQYFGELMQQYQQRQVRPGEDRTLVVHVHIEDSTPAAMAAIRAAHDERYRFLAAQRPIFGYVTQDGQPFPTGRIPTLEESMRQGGWFVGSPSKVREGLCDVAQDFGLESITVELGYAGLTKEQTSEQIERFALEVRPTLEATARNGVIENPSRLSAT
jgi:alkanesulfonate monooxygenase SsuD/methylene tetrahydromethanopterin reductase-like flavin-dependent oxidoreductase (luciferase family)